MRALSAALILAAAAAGCGGTTASDAALHAARVSGGADPSVSHAVRVRLANGYAKDVVLLRARFCGTGPVSTRHNGRCGTTDAWFALTPRSHKIEMSSFLTRGEVRAIDQARKASPALRVFPDVPGLLVRCTIPRGGAAAGTIDGTCWSGYAATKPGAGNRVEFLEHWPAGPSTESRFSARWIVALGAGGRVLSVRRTGHPPPQAWR